MRHGVFGTGAVGHAIAGKLAALGHDVKMGARDASNEKATAWAKSAGEKASHGTFADAAKFGDIIWNCTAGGGSLSAIAAAGQDNLASKILIDISNPLDFSKGMPPSLSIGNTDSLGEQIQRAVPQAKVVKTLNTCNAQVMVDPARVGGGDHHMFLCGNDPDAKNRVSEILRGWFGWKNVQDLGDITNARGTEGYLLLWIRLYGALKTADFNIKLVK